MKFGTDVTLTRKIHIYIYLLVIHTFVWPGKRAGCNPKTWGLESMSFPNSFRGGAQVPSLKLRFWGELLFCVYTCLCLYIKITCIFSYTHNYVYFSHTVYIFTYNYIHIYCVYIYILISLLWVHGFSLLQPLWDSWWWQQVNGCWIPDSCVSKTEFLTVLENIIYCSSNLVGLCSFLSCLRKEKKRKHSERNREGSGSDLILILMFRPFSIWLKNPGIYIYMWQ